MSMMRLSIIWVETGTSWILEIMLLLFGKSSNKTSAQLRNHGAIEHGGECLPQCVLCMKTISNAAMKPSLLKRHLVSNHAEKQGKDRSYFERLGYFERLEGRMQKDSA